ncbi:MAG TPA: aminoacyl-tRNA hydrolase [Actinomycetota bacterium]|nr:aminoacyl-tRNA hydrolase [Actinomycetota bacterium]
MSLFRRSSPGDEGRWIVYGLGNPGDRYAKTRHNTGVGVVEELLARTSSSFKRHKSGTLTAETTLGGDKVVLARSTGYMNDSGRPLGQLMRFYKTPLDKLIVVHDELDIPFGEVRVKLGGGTAGHNGLKSVGNHLSSKDFVRVRVGISRPHGALDGADYVLQTFSGAERKELPEIVERAADAVERIIEAGAERAMNEFNTRA